MNAAREEREGEKEEEEEVLMSLRSVRVSIRMRRGVVAVWSTFMYTGGAGAVLVVGAVL